MADLPADRRTAPRYAATFRIKLGYPDLSAFLEGYAVNISKGGIYVPTKQPREKGTEVRFELLLKDGSVAVSGQGRVAWSKAFDPAKPGERYGMGVQFMTLEGASDQIVAQAVAWREKHLSAEAAKHEVVAVEPGPKPAGPEAGRGEPEPKPAPVGAKVPPIKKKVSLGEVDNLLASLRAKRDAAKRPAAKPGPSPAASPVEGSSGEAPAPAPSPPVAAPAGVPRPGSEPERAPAPVAANAPPTAGATAGESDNLPSLEDLEAALKSVSQPPPPPPGGSANGSGEIPIMEGAPAVAAAPRAAPVPHDADGLELPSWDEESAEPLLSERLGTSDLGDDEGRSEVLEATDEDLDVDSLPLRLRTGAHRPVERAAAHRPAEPPPAEPFADAAAEAARGTRDSAPSRQELPVVGGVVSSSVGDALRSALGANSGEGVSDPDAPTTMMSEDEVRAIERSGEGAGRASLADLPPPPDMPAPIPSNASVPPPADDKKGGLFGRMFRRKKDK
jgi:uncharacterized protein (TIGR02266 family)